MEEYIRQEIFGGKNYTFFSLLRVLLLNLNLRFVFWMRLMFWLKEKNMSYLSGRIYRKLISNYGCFIGIKSKIGIGVKFPHPNGIVVGSTTVIGANCIIFQQVTFGGKLVGDAQKNCYPRLGDNITVFAGAKLIGKINIGNNVVIGANSVVNKDIPPYSVVAGVPAKIIRIMPHQV
jgi:serine O-acetyltransferase